MRNPQNYQLIIALPWYREQIYINDKKILNCWGWGGGGGSLDQFYGYQTSPSNSAMAQNIQLVVRSA